MPLLGTSCDVPSAEGRVNTILRNLRGEHFRHTRNLQQAPAALPLSTHNQPTLPFDQIFTRASDSGNQPSLPRRGVWVAGPSPPQSWLESSSSTTVPPRSTRGKSEPEDNASSVDIPAWRETALGPILREYSGSTLGHAYDHSLNSPVPSLIQICIYLIISNCRGEDLVHLAPYIPVHLRRALMRYAAVHTPLTTSELAALCNGQHSIDGELIVVGPRASLHRSWFQNPAEDAEGNTSSCGQLARTTSGHSCAGDDQGDAWDDAQSLDKEPTVLISLSLVSTSLTVPTFLTLPPTITHMALINLPCQVPLRRLPTVCPLLVFLDLSYNNWLRSASEKDPKVLVDVSWYALRHLRGLGLRGCVVTAALLGEINRGRWEGMKVIT
ncbi:hypothetical protein ID866_5594 [Astraeus odoratus]|nr:hypothetical protein ID866_5594 [Astraeus odoratus]